ncbi:Pectin lyase-like superfamily protein [Zea mays]|uniref:Pectin lyase-like superfamily protein n=1 Tax=Zea mays TaxID=4577 RepID=A0A1D6LRE0_MAIZE|nr:Pectin lyase-like superfamily protein [Zea mays]
MGISVWRHWEADNPYTQGRLPCRTTQLHRPVQGRRDHLGGWQSASDHIPKPVQGTWTTSTSSIVAPTTRPWIYARTPRAAPRVASRSLHASRPSVD